MRCKQGAGTDCCTEYNEVYALADNANCPAGLGEIVTTFLRVLHGFCFRGFATCWINGSARILLLHQDGYSETLVPTLCGVMCGGVSALIMARSFPEQCNRDCSVLLVATP